MSSSWDKRLAAWFEGRRWRVMTELDGTVTVGGVRFTYCKGAFEIEPPGVFVTPFGSRGRHGFVIIETGEDGRDIPGTGTSFGGAVLHRANEAYHTISGLPEEQK